MGYLPGGRIDFGEAMQLSAMQHRNQRAGPGQEIRKPAAATEKLPLSGFVSGERHQSNDQEPRMRDRHVHELVEVRGTQVGTCLDLLILLSC